MNKERGYFDGLEVKLWFSLWRIGCSFFEFYIYRANDGFFVRIWIFSIAIYVRWSIKDWKSKAARAWRRDERNERNTRKGLKRDTDKGWNS